MDRNPFEDLFKVTSAISDVLKGLDNGIFERIGGAIYEVTTGRIIAFLRETVDFKQVTSEAVSFLNGGAGLSILNFGVATMGFAVVLRRVNKIAKRLEETQELLEQLNQKLDLSFYANFRTALDLAYNAFTMVKPENRGPMARQAVDRLTEARHHYSALIEDRLDTNGPAVDAYLATLTLAFVAETRCYLELEELDLAGRRLDSGAIDLERHVRNQLNTLLTSNPSAYLHPSLKGTVDLRRLTKVLRWLNPSLDENAVFEEQRQNLFNLTEHLDEWLETLPSAIWDPKFDTPGNAMRSPKLRRFETPEINIPVPKFGNFKLPRIGFPRLGRNVETNVFARLGTILDTIEAMIEDMHRLRTYRVEIQAIQNLGVSFHQWQQLTPSTDSPEGNLALMCIIPHKPLDLRASI